MFYSNFSWYWILCVSLCVRFTKWNPLLYWVVWYHLFNKWFFEIIGSLRHFIENISGFDLVTIFLSQWKSQCQKESWKWSLVKGDSIITRQNSMQNFENLPPPPLVFTFPILIRKWNWVSGPIMSWLWLFFPIILKITVVNTAFVSIHWVKTALKFGNETDRETSLHMTNLKPFFSCIFHKISFVSSNFISVYLIAVCTVKSLV